MTEIANRGKRNQARGVICTKDGCEKGQYAKGLCHNHYIQLLPASLAKRGIVCIEEGCNEGPWARGKCKRHYYLAWRAKRRQERDGE